MIAIPVLKEATPIASFLWKVAAFKMQQKNG